LPEPRRRLRRRGRRDRRGVSWIDPLFLPVSDPVVNQENVGFHLALSAIMAALAAGAWYAGRLAGRRWG
jgi:hypothetical protein